MKFGSYSEANLRITKSSSALFSGSFKFFIIAIVNVLSFPFSLSQVVPFFTLYLEAFLLFFLQAPTFLYILKMISSHFHDYPQTKCV